MSPKGVYERVPREPKDDDQRFYVTRFRGYPIPTLELVPAQVAPFVYYVLDRAYCHQIIAEFDETFPIGPRGKQAKDLAKWLNAGRPKGDRCRSGHPYTADSSRIRKNGSRVCLVCKHANDRRYDKTRRPRRAKGIT